MSEREANFSDWLEEKGFEVESSAVDSDGRTIMVMDNWQKRIVVVNEEGEDPKIFVQIDSVDEYEQ